jgi:hypothetical protein
MPDPTLDVSRNPQARGLAGSRFAWFAAAFFAVTSILMTWPLAADLSAQYTSRQDFYLNLWILDWVARWLTEPGLALFHTDALYHPVGTGLASQDLTLVQTIAVAPLTLAHGPVVAFNALVLLSFWLAGFAAALWIRALTGDAAAGLFGGAIYTFAPYHLLYIPQLGMVAIGFIPLFLLADLSYSRAPTMWRAARAGLALAVVGLGAWYYGVLAGLVALVFSGARIARGGRSGRARVLACEGAYWAACGLVLAPVVFEMLPAFLDQPALSGSEEHAGIGLIMPAFKGTPSTVALWSFLGFVPLAFAALGVRPLRRSAVPLCLALVFLVLSLGESMSLGGLRIPLPYAWLQALPAVGAVRFPDRFFLMTQLGTAALAGLGLVMARRRWALPPAAVAAIVLLPLAEFWPGPLTGVHPQGAPPVPALSEVAPGAVLHVPTTFTHLDGEQMAHQVGHRRPIVGGYLMRRDPDRVQTLRNQPGLGPLIGGPGGLADDLAGQLREAGIRYVCVQRAPWVAGASDPPAAVMAPFSLAGRPFLRQRLFPVYTRHEALAQRSTGWERLLEARLGPPIGQTERSAVFEVPGL